MSNIDEFPKNPKDGDKFVSSDGIEYVYQEDKKNDGDAIICPPKSAFVFGEIDLKPNQLFSTPLSEIDFPQIKMKIAKSDDKIRVDMLFARIIYSDDNNEDEE